MIAHPKPLFLLILSAFTAAAAAERAVNLIIAVDRSGSVERAGTAATIRRALTDFVLSDGPKGTPAFVEGRDKIGIGSFGGSWKLDLAPTAQFRTGQPTAAKAIEEMPFGEGVTNTAEGLYQAYVLLSSIADPTALNIIVLLTDGRPNAFTAIFDVAGWCGDGSGKKGYITATIGPSWPPCRRKLRESVAYTRSVFISRSGPPLAT
jgi:hypothetical protein